MFKTVSRGGSNSLNSALGDLKDTDITQIQTVFDRVGSNLKHHFKGFSFNLKTRSCNLWITVIQKTTRKIKERNQIKTLIENIKAEMKPQEHKIGEKETKKEKMQNYEEWNSFYNLK